MKLLGSTKSEITKNENSENIPNLEITEVTLVHCNIVKACVRYFLKTWDTSSFRT